MPRRMPAETLPQLRAALASGKVPGYGEPGDDVTSEVWGDGLPNILQDAWRKPKNSAARRHVSALCDFWGNICMDGLIVGVAINDPGLVAAAQEAAAAMKLKKAQGILDKVAVCVPAQVTKLKSVDKRLAWYQSPKNEPLVAKLDKLDARINENDFIVELQEAIFRRLLAEPAEFFEL
jgi:hypothetical protein